MGWQEEHEEAMDLARRGLVRGARDAMGPFIAGLAEWDLFGGLTFDPKRCAKERVFGAEIPRRIPPDTVERRFRRFVRDAEKALRREVRYIAALESHKSGWPHLHPLLALEDGLQPGDVATLGGLWFTANGYARLEAPRTLADVTGYCAKYLAKDYAVGRLLLDPRLTARAGAGASLG